MDKTQLKRHDLIYVSPQGKDKIWQALAEQYTGAARTMVEEVLLGDCDIPGFVRRGSEPTEAVPVGFVHYCRLNGSRLRIGALAAVEDIVMVMTPYEVMQRRAFAVEEQTECLEILFALYELAEEYDLQVGVLGSAALELATGLPYTDEGSDIDLLVKPASFERLQDFYRMCRENFTGINMDFELELPNGYGIKLAEIFMDTRTVLGKSIDNVALLNRKDIMTYLV